MSHTADQLIKMAVNYEQLATESLVSTAKKKEKKLDPKAKGNKKLPPWLKNKSKKSDTTDKKTEKKSKKSSLEFIDSLLSKYAAE